MKKYKELVRNILIDQGMAKEEPYFNFYVEAIVSCLLVIRNDTIDEIAKFVEGYWEEKPSFLGTDELAEAIEKLKEPK